jgi:hypothetical protein
VLVLYSSGVGPVYANANICQEWGVGCFLVQCEQVAVALSLCNANALYQWQTQTTILA